LVDELINLIPIFGGNFVSKTVLNLQTDNEQVINIYNAVVPVSKVAFYGAEDKDQTLWRMAY